MNGRRRVRTGQRRDDGVRRIDTNEVRYPGLELPETLLGAEEGDLGSGLRPARDTGLAITGRQARERRLRAKSHRRTAITLLAVFGVLVVLGSAWKVSSDRAARVAPLASSSTSAQEGAAPRRSGTIAEEAAAAVLHATSSGRVPTPNLATYKKLTLRLPVATDDVTEVGFHQASYAYARHMKSLVPYGDAEKAKKNRGTGRDLAQQKRGADAVLTGVVLKLWRSRPGKPDTAVDVGADAGSTVYSPVTGTVVKVKKFDLYGKYPDVEIHIQPEGYPHLDVVMIHVSEVICQPGDRVVAGTTPIAQIRDLDKRIGPQLKRYTRNGGTHTHVQVNDATYPGYKGLKGAIKVESSSDTTP